MLALYELFRRAGLRGPSTQRLVQHDPERVPISRRRDYRSHGLLGSHVERRAHDPTGLRIDSFVQFGDHAKIHEHHPARALHQHIGRLEVAVDDAPGVHGVEGFGELRERHPHALQQHHLGDIRPRIGRGQIVVPGGDPEPVVIDVAAYRTLNVPQAGAGRVARGTARRTFGDRPERTRDDARRVRVWVDTAEIGHQVHTVDDLHGQEPLVALGDQFVELDDISVRQPGQGSKLALESIHPRSLRPAQLLERHLHAALAIVDRVDHAHPSLAEGTNPLEALGHKGQVSHRRHGSEPRGQTPPGLRRAELAIDLANSWIRPGRSHPS